ncbi:MAG: asparaginase [Betaproteobacteria bacterium]
MPALPVDPAASFTRAVSHGAPPHVPLAVATRGAAVDAVHYGSVAVVDRDGNLLHAAGDPHFLTMTRSALKPFQAMPFVAGGGIERFGYASEQIALLCASHSGEPRHVAAVADMLARAGNTEADLQCGTHAPGFYDARGDVPPPPPYSPLAHNCSGKHSGMLAYCVQCGLPKSDYLAFDHPLQRAIRAAVAHFTDTAETELVSGIDGCSAPNYAVPLAGLALGFARLAADGDDPRYGAAPKRLADAMTAHPEMVSGEHRNDLALMRAGRGDWVTKIGAEGVQAIGVRSKGIGIAVKVIDGAKRGLHPATVEVLDQLGLLDAARRAELAPWREPLVRNYRGTVTGAVRPLVVLDKAAGWVPAEPPQTPSRTTAARR